MSYRIAINGYGRIGRCVLRALYESTNYADLRIVAINDLADSRTLAHLTRYDSTHGRFLGTVAHTEDSLEIAGDSIAVSRCPDLSSLPWQQQEIDLVLECSGAFSDRNTAERHLQQGANKVLFSQPAESDVDFTAVWGINHEQLQPEHRIISNASCTTNCIVPVLASVDEELGIRSGIITTIHSAMNDQPVIDSYHHHDLRRTRSAMQSIIPVETALARGIERILPQLQGKLSAQAIRVPTVNVSAMDLTLMVQQEPAQLSVESVNAMLRHASERLPANVLGTTDEPLASCDFNHDPRSAIVDLTQTRIAPGGLVNLLVWFDNEWAYANRMLDVAQFLHSLDSQS
ncbi:MAG: erythrose-4-phosphate dehydrogenase, partial [Pseudomonadales bacterium]|nr:erythrose-4-phosphate dehydrogenase [Pseudomonadales bacterium]